METWRRKAGVPQGPRTKFRFPHHNSPCDSVCRLHKQVPQLLCSGNEDVVGHGVRAYPLQQVFVWADCLKLLPVRLAMDLLSSSSVLFFTSLEREREAEAEVKVEGETERGLPRYKTIPQWLCRNRHCAAGHSLCAIQTLV